MPIGIYFHTALCNISLTAQTSSQLMLDRYLYKRTQQWLAQDEMIPPLFSVMIPSLAPTELYTVQCSRLHAPRTQCTVNWDRNLKPKLALMRQCTSVTDRQTLTSQHKREMHILHLALIKLLVILMSGRTFSQ